MPDPVSKVEIEDVLSSIRRLVSEEPHPARRRAEVSEAKDRLVLTPAQRVGDSDDEEETVANGTDPEAAEADNSSVIHLTNPVATEESEPAEPDTAEFEEAEAEVSEAEAAEVETIEPETAEAAPEAANTDAVVPTLSLEDRIAGLEAALVRAGGTWEPDGSEDGSSDETRPLSADANYDFLADWEREAAAAAMADLESHGDEAVSDAEPENASMDEAEAVDTSPFLLTEDPVEPEAAAAEADGAQEASETAEAEEVSIFAESTEETEDLATQEEAPEETAEETAEVDEDLVALADEPDEAPEAETSEADDQIDIVASIDRFLAEAEEKEAAEAAAETEAAADVDDSAKAEANEAADEELATPAPEHDAEPEADEAPEPEIAFFTARTGAKAERPAPEPVEEEPAADWEDFEDTDSFGDYSGADETVESFAEETDDFDDDLPDAQDDSVLAGEEAVLDEEALREMVAELVREELQGVLGERITRNVRRLIRREIERALALRDLSS